MERRNPRRLGGPLASRKERSAMAPRSPVCRANVLSRDSRHRTCAPASSPSPQPLPSSCSDDPSPPRAVTSIRPIPSIPRPNRRGTGRWSTLVRLGRVEPLLAHAPVVVLEAAASAGAADALPARRVVSCGHASAPVRSSSQPPSDAPFPSSRRRSRN